DTRTNALVRRIALGPAGPGGGAVLVSTATGRAFVFTGKRVLVLDTARGRILRVIRHPSDGQPVVDERTGRVFVAEQDWNATPGAQVACSWSMGAARCRPPMRGAGCPPGCASASLYSPHPPPRRGAWGAV